MTAFIAPALWRSRKWHRGLATCASSRPMSSNHPGSHAITSTRPIRFKRVAIGDFEAYRVNGTPADCVALGTHHWGDVDLVLSGINLGPNLGNAVWHSGTLAAAKQAALLGMRGIAFSTSVHETKEPDFVKLEPYVVKVLDLLLGDKSMCGKRKSSRKTERHSLDTAGDRSIRRQGCSRQRSDGPPDFLVHGQASRR
jgi:5'/3'-nucleotidase SurE